MEKRCPHCDADISDTWQESEPDVGIFSSGWYCEKCDEFFERDYDDFEEPYRSEPDD